MASATFGGELPAEAAGQHGGAEDFEEVRLALGGHVLQGVEVAVGPGVDVFPVGSLPSEAEETFGLFRVGGPLAVGVATHFSRSSGKRRGSSWRWRFSS